MCPVKLSFISNTEWLTNFGGTFVSQVLILYIFASQLDLIVVKCLILVSIKNIMNDVTFYHLKSPFLLLNAFLLFSEIQRMKL